MSGKVIGKLSAYANALPAAEKSRYVEKIKIINFTDPYAVPMNSTDFPTTVTTGHIIDYLLNQPMPSSGKHFKNMRSIEAYRKFEAGFVSNMTGTTINNLHLQTNLLLHRNDSPSWRTLIH